MARAAKYNKVATKPASKVQNGTTKAKAVALLLAKETETDIIKSAFIKIGPQPQLPKEICTNH
ncbi:hypothetical protein FF38_06559 [Lucilia cuprina]|uniref:Uncharacterized protein n=1 Tax=Lucilia cuprina TaxID=7375 RepID=A0A0L0C565_LUCCU|nr:hypothetical protein FF38_06559 [Lucilia cuprina]